MIVEAAEMVANPNIEAAARKKHDLDWGSEERLHPYEDCPNKELHVEDVIAIVAAVLTPPGDEE